MKRVKAACLSQTLHSEIKDELPHDEAVRLVKADVERYKADLERKGIRYRIDDEADMPDGSVTLKVRKQYLTAPVGEYLD